METPGNFDPLGFNEIDLSDIEFDLDNPLARIRGERRLANLALSDYARLGPGRSLAKLRDHYREVKTAWNAGEDPDQIQTESGPGLQIYEPPTLQLSTLKSWSSRYDWVRRVYVYEANLAAAETEKWERRREELRESDWFMGETLRARLEELLETLPKHIDELIDEIPDPDDPDNRTIRIVHRKLTFNLNQFATALKTAVDVRRLAAEEPTEIWKLKSADLENEILSLIERYSEIASPGDPRGTEGES